MDNAYLSSEKHTGVIVTTHGYDQMGRMTESVNGNGNATAYAYDAMGKVTRITNPDGTTIMYDRDYEKNAVIVKR